MMSVQGKQIFYENPKDVEKETHLSYFLISFVITFFMSYILNLFTTFKDLFTQLGIGLGGFLPAFIGGVLILCIGVALALLLQRLVKRIIGQGVIQWDKLFSNIGIEQVFEERLNLSTDVGAFVGWLIKWFLLTVSFVAAVRVWGLVEVITFLAGLITFIPLALTAALMIFVGLFIARFLKRVVTRVIGTLDINKGVIGIAVYWIIAAYSVLAAARFLNLDLTSIWPKFIDFLVFASAIAVGFGLSSRAGEWIEKIKGGNNAIKKSNIR